MRRPRSLHPLLKERIEVWKGKELGKLDWRPTPERRSRQKQLKKEPQLDFEPPGHSNEGYLTDKKYRINQAAEKIEAILAEPCFTKWLEALPSNSRRQMAQCLATCIIRLVYIRPEILRLYKREDYSKHLKKSKSPLKKVEKCKSQFFDLWLFFRDDRLYRASRVMDLLYRSVSSWQIEASPPKGMPEAPWRRWLEEFYVWILAINSRFGPTYVREGYVPIKIEGVNAIVRILSRVVPESPRKFDPATPGRNSDIRKHARYCQQIYGPPPQPKLRESGGEPPPPDQQSQVTIKA